MMECTQRLDSEFSQTQTERICPEQIGFLGILGTKYPVKRGPNKIGRDPQSCSIVLNLNSISRQHAVLNVINGKEYMLMDLESANKTRLNNRTLQAYIPVPISNGDTVQFGDAFGIFRLLEEENDLPCTQAVDLPCTQVLDIPETPAHQHTSRIRHATIPESPDVSDKDDSFVVPSQPKPLHKIKSTSNNFINSSSKPIAIQPVGTNQIDNIFWKSSKKSDSFNLDDSNSSLNESQGEVRNIEAQSTNDSADSIYNAETQLPPKCASIDSIYTAETQLPPKCASTDSIYTAETQLPPECASDDSIYTAETQLPQICASIYSQETQLPPADLISDNENDNDIFNAETKVIEIFDASMQLPNGVAPKSKKDENINDADAQLPYVVNTANNDDMFEAETKLPSKELDLPNKSIHEMETQAPLPSNNENMYSIYSMATQLPPVSASPSIYSQETQLPRLDELVVQDTPKSIHDIVNTSSKNDDIFIADMQSPDKVNKANDMDEIRNDDNSQLCYNEPHKNNNSTNAGNTSKDKSKDEFDTSNEILLIDEVAVENELDDFNASQPLLCGVGLLEKEESEDIPLSQSDTITDDDFEIRLEDDTTESKPAKRDICANTSVSTDCHDLDFLPTQKVSDIAVNQDSDTDCEDDGSNNKNCKEPVTAVNSKIDFNVLDTQVIPAAEPAFHLDDLATQVIPEIAVDNNVQKDISEPKENPYNEPKFEDMLTQMIPEENFDENTNFEDLPTQVITENDTKEPNINNYSEEVVFSPFKVPFHTAIKMKKKDISKANIIKISSPVKPIAQVNDSEKYYSATQELLEDLCSQEILPTEPETLILVQRDGEFSNEVEDGKVGTKFANLEGEMEISVKKIAKGSPESINEEEKVSVYVRTLSDKQINEVVGADVTMVKRVPSDPTDVEVTPKKVRPRKFMETLLPDSQEIKTSVSICTRSETMDSSSESEQEKESQELTPIVFHKNKRVKADVKAKLTSRFDVQALPTRIITRARKPTAKLQESENSAKKRGKNILKPKFLNDSDQDDVDSEIISENIIRLRSKTERKNNKDTSADDKTINYVKNDSKIKRKSNEENIAASTQKNQNKSKSKNNSKDIVVDLTIVNEEKPRSRRRNENSKTIKDTQANSVQIDDVKSKEVQIDISKQKSEFLRNSISKKKDVQDKITNYTITVDEKSKSNANTMQINESLSAKDDKNNSTKSTRQNNKHKDIISYCEKTEESDHVATTRKRGRPKKNKIDTQKDNNDDRKSKLNKNRNDSKNNTSKNKDDIKESKRRKKNEPDAPSIIEPEVRRSRRQRITKGQNESQSLKCDQSTVYSISSESGVDSPKRKRGHLDTDAPSSKRTRSNPGSSAVSLDTSSVSTTLNSNCSSLRSTPSLPVNHHRVLFTAFPNEEVKVKLLKLGAAIVSEVPACTVVLTLQLRRTFKLLCAVALGKPVAGPEWVQACVEQQTIVDPWQYLLRDEANEARFRFSLRRTLCGPRGYLKGYHVTSTPSVLPSAPEMKLIVECSGGVWQNSGPKGRWLVVSCAADRALHEELKSRGAILVTSELILTGVLRQHLDIEGNRIL